MPDGNGEVDAFGGIIVFYYYFLVAWIYSLLTVDWLRVDKICVDIFSHN
jgi:hypothetical protein